MQLFKNRPLALLSASLLLGSLITLFLYRSGISPLGAAIPLLLLFVVSLFLAKGRRSLRLVPAIALCLLLASLAQVLHHGRRFSALEAVDGSKAYTVTATVTAVEEGAPSYALYTVRVSSLNGEDADLYLSLRIDPRVSSGGFSRGDSFSADILVVSTAREDGYYYSHGIAGYAVAERVADVAAEDAPFDFHDLNLSLHRRLKGAVGGEEAALLSALFLGNRSGLSPSTTLAFRRAGLSHALALSGMHLAVLAAILLRLFRAIRLPEAVATPLFLLALVFYTALAGAPLSLLRSAGMLAIARLGILLRRIPDSVTSLFVSVALIVTLSPGAVADIGLWLSFLATLGLLTAGELFPVTEKKHTAFPMKLLRALLYSLFVLAFTLLLSAVTFGSFSLLAPVSTLIVSPLIELLLLLTPLLLPFTYPNLLTEGVALLTRATLSLVEWLAAPSFVYVSARQPVFLVALTLFSLLLALLLLLPLNSRKLFLRSFFTAFLALAVTFTACHLYANSRDFVLYVKHYATDHVVIKQNGSVTVIGTGSSEHAIPSLIAALEEEHITDIDTLILTEVTDSHSLYLTALSESIRVGEAILLCNERNARAVTGATRTANALSLPCRTEGASFTLTEGALTLRILSGLYTMQGAHPELVVRITLKGHTLLYASANAPALWAGSDAAHRFSEVEQVLLGAYPAAPSTLLTSPFPDGTPLLAAYPNSLIASEDGVGQLSSRFLFPAK